jgi:acetyl-CoA carboxylase biotin carboxyl carrier protein
VTLTAKDVAEITRLLAESDFDELFLELDGLKLTLRRNGAAAPPPADAAPAATPSPVATPSPAAAVPASAAAHVATQSVTAPLLGTFYRAPKPGAPPFVEVGSTVEEDTIIGIIEVMKLMNTVRAGARGTVVEIPAQDGALVEYGETLMRVSKAAEA